MAHTTLGELRKALKKAPEDRTDAERAMIEEAGPELAEAARNMQAALETTNEALRSSVKPIAALASGPRAIAAVSRGAAERLFYGPQREKAESRDREIAMLEALTSIDSSLRGLVEKVAEHERRLDEQQAEFVSLRTGTPGRPTAMHLVENEFKRRVEAKQIEATLSEQARVLLVWLRENHPEAAKPTEKTVRNRLGAAYKRAAGRDRQEERVASTRSRRTRR